MRMVFITWYPSCRRSDAIAEALGGVSHLIHYFNFKQPLQAPFKYVMQALDTLRRLRRELPRVVFVASPPVFAVLPVWLYCAFHRSRFVIDAHTGVFDDPRWKWLTPVTRFLARRAAATIVTNDHLAAQVRAWGAKAIIIGDVPVTFPASEPVDLGGGTHVVVVNTFSQDEPVEDIIAAARKLPEVRFHITGNPKHARSRIPQSLPANVRLTGWLPESEYAGLLRASDAVMCLTTHDHTMQRGAYEAMALGKPLVTSDWGVLRKTFCRGTIHVENSPDAIVAGVVRAMRECRDLAASMEWLRHERAALFAENLKLVREELL
jgi:glycosyltransferase involved in cell wall biosynthesis